MATYFSMRRALVSGFLASWIRYRIAYLFLLSSLAKNSRARSFFSSSRRRSSGTVALLCASYAASHRPSALARSTSRKPAGFISPCSMSCLTFSRLTFDHLLLALRGRESLQPVALVELVCLAVDPAVTEGDVEGLRMGNTLDARVLLCELHPQPARGSMVLFEPSLPCLAGLERDDRRVRFGGHSVSLQGSGESDMSRCW